MLVDQCIDCSAPDAGLRLDRYAAYARRSGVDAETVAGAMDAIGRMTSMVPAPRNEELLVEAGSKRPRCSPSAWPGAVGSPTHPLASHRAGASRPLAPTPRPAIAIRQHAFRLGRTEDVRRNIEDDGLASFY